jgi:hypothetical protein
MSPFTTRTYRLPLLAGLAAIAPFAAQAQNSVTINQSYSYLPQNSGINLLDLGNSTGVNGRVTNNVVSFDGGTISFAGNAGIFHGSAPGLAAAPWTPTGLETRNYFAAQPNGDITVSFDSSQKYFAINWGSIDGYNSMQFYQNNSLVRSVTGSQIVSNPSGVQNATGSYLVNFTFNGSASFDKVVMKSGSPAFEFNMIAYAPTPINLAVVSGTPTVRTLVDTVTKTVVGAPAPAPLPGLAATPLGLLALFGVSQLFLRRRTA